MPCWIGGAFSTNGIAYSSTENTLENGFNQLLAVETDKRKLYLKATMGMFDRASESKLPDEGAAEHLWSTLISPLQWGRDVPNPADFNQLLACYRNLTDEFGLDTRRGRGHRCRLFADADDGADRAGLQQVRAPARAASTVARSF